MDTDYEKLTVAKLKLLCQERSIPLKGLTRKAQYIDRLRERDAAAAIEEIEVELGDLEAAGVKDEVIAEVSTTIIAPVSELVAPAAAAVAEASTTGRDDKVAVDDAEPRTIASPAKAVSPSPAVQDDGPLPSTPAIKQGRSMSSIIANDTSLSSAIEKGPSSSSIIANNTSSSPIITKESTPLAKDTSSSPVDASKTTSPPDFESMKKRKRRSATPPLNTQYLEAIKPQLKQDVHLPEDSVSLSKPKNSLPSPMDIDAPVDKRPEINNDNVDLPPSKKLKPSTPVPRSSLHAVSNALYVKNFMRPLNPEMVRQYMYKITGEATAVEKLHLDAIRTHAFIQFTSPDYATLAREALHEKVWPEERDRKQLWADYVPSESLDEWISMEKQERGNIKRWEVIYESGNADNSVVAYLVEQGQPRTIRKPLPLPKQDPRIIPPLAVSVPTPLSSRPAAVVVPLSARLQPPPPSRQTAVAVASPKNTSSFIQLDNLFSSTKTAKPMLYYLPVNDEVAERRRRELANETRRSWSWLSFREGDDLGRYTFEQQTLVSTGQHFQGARAKRGRAPSIGGAVRRRRRR